MWVLSCYATDARAVLLRHLWFRSLSECARCLHVPRTTLGMWYKHQQVPTKGKDVARICHLFRRATLEWVQHRRPRANLLRPERVSTVLGRPG